MRAAKRSTCATKERSVLVADALPVRAAAPYVIRHGFGYSVFETRSDGICSELWVYVAIDAAVKFSVLKLRNESGRPRRLSATGYVEWVLGDLRAKSAMHVSTEIDPRSGALYARNPYSPEFADRVAFFDVDEPLRKRQRRPHGIHRAQRHAARSGRLHPGRLSGKVGAGLDPCGAIQVASIWPTGRSGKSSSGSVSGATPTRPAS
jgi:cyclic beta-1,2-glucan synthetase